MSKKQIVELAGIDSEHAAPPPAVDAPLIRERMEVIVEVMATLLSRARLQWTMVSVKAHILTLQGLKKPRSCAFRRAHAPRARVPGACV